MGFDIKTVDVTSAADKGIEVTFMHPVTGPTDFKIRVKGLYSPEFRELLARAAQREEMRKKRGVNSGEEDGLAILLARVTLGWSGLNENGLPVEFSRANAERIYSEYPLVKQQVWEAAGEVTNFIQNSRDDS